MFILTCTFRNKKITISAVTIETTFFSAPLPIKGLLFFCGIIWLNILSTLYRNWIQQEHRKEKYTQQLSGIFINKAEESYILTVILKKQTHILRRNNDTHYRIWCIKRINETPGRGEEIERPSPLDLLIIFTGKF